jgi:hypothetical protein
MSMVTKYVVIEHAGSDYPVDIREFKSLGEALRFVKHTYEEDELESLDVLVLKDIDGDRTSEY